MPCRLLRGSARPTLCAPACYPTCRSRCLSLSSAGNGLEEATPVAFGVEDGAHFIATCSVKVKTAMLQLDARSVLAVGEEAHLDFRLQGRVVLPVGADLPVEHQARVRFPQEYAAPVTRASIVAALVPATADPRLDHRVHRLGPADLVGCQRPPRAHPLGEDAPRHLRRRLNVHNLPHPVRLVTFTCHVVVHDDFLPAAWFLVQPLP